MNQIKVTTKLLLCFAFFSVFSCSRDRHELLPQNDNAKRGTTSIQSTAPIPSSASNGFDPNVGGFIDPASRQAWAKAYTDAGYKTFADTIPSRVIEGILADTACVGISFHYAVTPAGRVRIIPVGVSRSGLQILPGTVTIGNSSISMATAQQWMNKWTMPVQAHFFGINFLKSFLIAAKGADILLMPGLNAKGPQLILGSVTNPDSSPVGDDSWPCPPSCPQ